METLSARDGPMGRGYGGPAVRSLRGRGLSVAPCRQRGRRRLPRSEGFHLEVATMFPFISRQGLPRKRQRPRWQPRLEGLEGRALLSQAGDLLINGDFSSGNSGFASDYTFTGNSSASLVPE